MIILTDKYQEVNAKELMKRGLKPKLGYIFEKGGNYVHDHRCLLCGKWFSYSRSDIPKMIEQNRWDFVKDKPRHCDNSSCYDYEEECRYWDKVRQEQKKDKCWELFSKLKKQKLVF